MDFDSIAADAGSRDPDIERREAQLTGRGTRKYHAGNRRFRGVSST
jgi:hypothetical protein